MGFWGTLGKIGMGGAGLAAAPFTGGASFAAMLPAILGTGASVAGGLLNQRAANKGSKYAGETASTTSGTNATDFQFDPTSMDAFNTLTPQSVGVFGDYMRDPRQSSFFNEQLAGSNRLLAGQADRQKANLGLNMAALGAAPDPMRQAEMVNQIGRSSSATQSDTFLQLLMQAEERRRNAATTALNYRPLQTGSNSTINSTTSGTNNSTQSTNGGGSIWGDLLGMAGAGLGAYGASRGGSPTFGSNGGAPMSGAFVNPRFRPGSTQPWGLPRY